MAEPSPEATVESGQEPPVVEGQEPVAEEGKTDSGQEPHGKTYSQPYVQQLRREAAGARNRVSELEEKLQEFEDRDKSELQKLTDKIGDAERRAAESETRLLRYEVAAEHGLGPEAAKFLTGTTREELELRAEELSNLLADKGRLPTAGFDGGARAPVTESKKPEDAHNDLILRSLGRGA